MPGLEVFIEHEPSLRRDLFIKADYQGLCFDIQAMKKALGESPGPVNLTATMNAGAIPANSWVQDMEVGGGRIIGEACHYLDLLAYLAGSPIESLCMNALGPEPKVNTDCFHFAAVCQRIKRRGELFCQRAQGVFQGACGGLQPGAHAGDG